MIAHEIPLAATKMVASLQSVVIWMASINAAEKPRPDDQRFNSVDSCVPSDPRLLGFGRNCSPNFPSTAIGNSIVVTTATIEKRSVTNDPT